MGHLPGTTKEKLFLAALQVFADKGYKGATVRQICQVAESANMTAVTYHFGGKARLYKSILEMMFSELGKQIESQDAMSDALSPEKRLCEIIRIYCSMLFGGGQIGNNFLAIFNAELAHPSPFFNKLIERSLISQNRQLRALIDEIIGPGAPRWLLMDCVVSIFSQIIYYSVAWPVYSRVNPDHPGMAVYHEHLAAHVSRFSLAGLKEMKRAYAAGELVAPGEFGK